MKIRSSWSKITKDRGLRLIAFLKIFRGSIALTGGFFLLTLLDSDFNLSVSRIESYLDSENRDLVLAWLAHQLETSEHLFTMAVITFAFVFSAFRFIEAWGLLFELRWAEWLSVIHSGIYMILEIIYLTKSFSYVVLIVFGINLCVFAYLSVILLRSREKHSLYQKKSGT